MDSRPPTVTEHPPLQTVLTSLTDEDSRRILETLNDPLSAREIADACDIPLSTTYRKLNDLSEASLVSEQLDVSEHGKHTTRYQADFERITVELTKDGAVQISVASELSGSDPVVSARWQEITQ